MDFIKYKNICFSVSILYILIGLLLFFVRGLNLDIDFTSGTLIQMKINQFVSDDEIRDIVRHYLPNVHIVRSGVNNDTIILKTTKSFSLKELNEYKADFEKHFLLEPDQITTKIIGANVGIEARNKALISIALATTGILVYVSYRFKLDYGVASVVAVFHDVLFLFSTYSIFQIPVNGSFIAAILTVLGYSINDTIVIFDRIRENMRLYHEKDEYEHVNDSIKQCMKRTVVTSITTLLAIVTLYMLGVNEVKVLALPLMIGVSIGVYSTVFIASPLWYILRSKGERSFI